MSVAWFVFGLVAFVAGLLWMERRSFDRWKRRYAVEAFEDEGWDLWRTLESGRVVKLEGGYEGPRNPKPPTPQQVPKIRPRRTPPEEPQP